MLLAEWAKGWRKKKGAREETREVGMFGKSRIKSKSLRERELRGGSGLNDVCTMSDKHILLINSGCT